MDATAAPDASPAPNPTPSPSSSPQQSPRFEARLRHADSGTRVVEVSAWLQGSCLGRCLGEGASAEEAEDRALARLRARLQAEVGAAPLPPPPPGQHQPPLQTQSQHTLEAAPAPRDRSLVRRNAAATATAAEPAASLASPPPAPVPPAPLPTSPGPSGEPPADPDDWSDELAELDVHLQRLGWDREGEGVYLERAFGHPGRNRLTAFADLAAYLRTLRGLATGSRPETAPVPLRRSTLLSQSNQLLSSLSWDAEQGRRFLEQQFQISSRQQLSDEQLLQFNMLLEEQLINAGSAPPAAAPPG